MGLARHNVVALGAASGLGRGVALVHAAQGATVSRSGPRFRSFAEGHGRGPGLGRTRAHHHCAGSITAPDDLARVMTAAAGARGCITAHFLNDGGPVGGNFVEPDDAVWQRALDGPLLGYVNETAAFNCYAGVCKDFPLPVVVVVVQDHPVWTTMQMPTDLIVRIVDDLERLAGAKAEAVPTAAKVASLKQRVPHVPGLTGLGAVHARFGLVCSPGPQHDALTGAQLSVLLEQVADGAEILELAQLNGS